MPRQSGNTPRKKRRGVKKIPRHTGPAALNRHVGGRFDVDWFRAHQVNREANADGQS